MREHVLIVDDEVSIRDSFRIMLGDRYEVSTAKGGNECLELVKKGEKFSLIILDLRMPDSNGIDVLRKIRKINSSLPVIILTAAGTHKVVIEALKLGAADFLAKPVDVNRMQEVIKKILSKAESDKKSGKKNSISVDELLNENFAEALKVLTEVIEAKDPYLKRHSKQTAKYAVAIGEKLNLSKEQIDIIKQTCLLHDIGKVGVSDSMLNKKEKLNPQEWQAIKKHPEIGEKILEHFKLMHIEQAMIRYHHERYDGKGYPDGLKGKAIPIYARILAVADAFESMTAGRVYKKPLSIQEATKELKKGSGTQFDPKMVEVFLEVLREKKV